MNAGSGSEQRSVPMPAVRMLLPVLWLACFAAPLALAGGGTKARTVVVLYPDANDGRPGGILVDRGIRSTFAAGSSEAVEIHSEHLDVSRFPEPDYQHDLAEFLRRKYADRKIDVVIAGLASGLDFALKHREQVFPGVPIIHCGVDHREISARNLPADVIGVPIKMDLAGTLDAALRLHPGTQRVYVITGKSNFDVQWQGEARRCFQAFEDKLEFIDLAGLPMPDLLQRVGALPEASIIYFVHLFQDGDGAVWAPAEALKLVAGEANVPVYGHADTYVGRGIVGGRVFSFEAAGANAAALGLRVLAGEKPETIGTQPVAESRYLFDARQLARWGISGSSLPVGSEVRHHDPGFWDLYRWHILGVASVVVLQTLLIIGLLVQRASRWRAESRFQQAVVELRELTGRLLLAQETERRRVARELHDDLNQNLAILAVELDMLRQKPAETPAQLEERLRHLSAQVKQLSSAVHELSHELHPTKLEQLGLVAAVIGLGTDLSRSHGVEIAVKHRDVPKKLPDDTSLCLYRIVQESLNNVVKHSGAGHATVELTGNSHFITLSIVDDGNGFDASALGGKEGLGLLSMRERLRLARGEIAIQSQPGAGTRIDVRVPLDSPEINRIDLQ